VPIDRGSVWANTWNIRPYLFLFWFIFSPDSPTEITRARNFTHHGSKHALWRKEVPVGGPHDGRQHFGVKIPQKPSKMAFYKHVPASAIGLKTNDVIEDWRHRLAHARGRAAYTIYSVLEITAAVILQYLQRNDSVSWCTIFGTEIQFCKIYIVFVGNLFYRLAHEKILYAVCWKASKTAKTLINKRRTWVNHWAKVANKTANINVQNRRLYASYRRHYTSKTANIKKVILLSSTLTLRQCHSAWYEIIAIFKALSYINWTPETPL